jgi:hypothetical protein
VRVREPFTPFAWPMPREDDPFVVGGAAAGSTVDDGGNERSPSLLDLRLCISHEGYSRKTNKERNGTKSVSLASRGRSRWRLHVVAVNASSSDSEPYQSPKQSIHQLVS